MEIKEAAYSVLEQLETVLNQISRQDYIKVIPTHDASVGQHARHMIEFFECLFAGLDEGKINYDKRNRDIQIETQPEVAMARIKNIKKFIKLVKGDPPIILEINYNLVKDESNLINTTFTRELAYNIEHTIHHMAIIKSIFPKFFDYVELPENFGIAVSTIRFRNKAFNLK